MAKPIGACFRFSVAIIVVASIVGVEPSWSYQFPDFVVIEQRHELPVCGGWVVDRQPHRWYVLVPEDCVSQVDNIRELQVRYGSAKVSWRTHSLGVDRKMFHPTYGQLAMLSTFGKFRRQSMAYEAQHHNGTVLVSWTRRHGVLEKTALVVQEEDQERHLPQLIASLMCKDSGFSFEGAFVLRNLQPYAMLSISKAPDSDDCNPQSVQVLKLGDFTSWWNVSSFQEVPQARLEELDTPHSGWFEEANSPFGFIMYVIFLSYSMIYTMCYFIFALGKRSSSSSSNSGSRRSSTDLLHE